MEVVYRWTTAWHRPVETTATKGDAERQSPEGHITSPPSIPTVKDATERQKYKYLSVRENEHGGRPATNGRLTAKLLPTRKTNAWSLSAEKDDEMLRRRHNLLESVTEVGLTTYYLTSQLRFVTA